MSNRLRLYKSRFIQVNPQKRLSIVDVRKKILNLKSRPLKFTNRINSNPVTDCTQTSMNVMKLVKDFRLLGNDYSTRMMTCVHDQRKTNLCHSFAIISCLRHLMGTFFRKLKKKSSDEIKKIIAENTTFEQMLAIFIACVSPRSMDGLMPNSNYKQLKIDKQFALLETVIKRLILRTAFEVEGWKRLLPIKKLFDRFKVDSEKWKLNYNEIVFKLNAHPNYTKELTVQVCFGTTA